MAIHTTSLTFETSDQSLWSAGDSYNLSIDTGDSLIFSTSGSTDLDFDLLGNGFIGEAYLDLQLGLFAYATLGRTGGLEATLDLVVNPEMPGGILIATENSSGQLINAAPSGTFDVDFSNWELVSSSLETEGFSSSAAAGLNFVLGLEAGLRNAEYYHWFGGGTLDDMTLIDIDWTGDDAIPLITIDASQPELELELNKYITISARLPTGADTENQVTYGIGDAPTITASGASDTRFLELSVDLDELLVQYAGKLPGVGAIIKGLGETIFAEHEFDLADYVPLIPRDKLVVKATALDISANTGIVVTESSELDFGGQDGVPNVEITITSDNGTPDYGLDDQTEVVALGDSATFLRPVYQQGATGVSAVPDLGDITLDTSYALTDVTLDHDVGFGLNSVFVIEALQAELTGGWVPSALQVSFGPLLSLELPDGGFTFDLFSFDSDPFALQDGAFADLTDQYEIFFSTELAPGQTSEADLEAANARQAIIDYREARQANVAEAVSAFGDLIDGHTQYAIGSGGNNFILTASGNVNTFAVWDGYQNSTITQTRGADDFYVVKPLSGNEDDGQIRVQLRGNGTQTGGHGFDMSDHEVMLNRLGTIEATFVDYFWHRGSFDENAVFTDQSFDVIGGNQGDLLVWFDTGGTGGDAAVLLDGSGESVGSGQYDRLLADFGENNPNVAIELDLVEMKTAGTGATLGEGTLDLTVRDIEALSIRTGDMDDFIVGYVNPDFIDTGAGDDYVILPGDNANDIVTLGDDDDFLRLDFKVGGGADLALGGRGYDQAAIFADPTGLGLRVDVVGDSVATAGGDGYGAGTSVADMATLLGAYATKIHFGSSVDQLDRTGLTGSDNQGDVIRYTQSDGINPASVINLNSSFENISVFGSDSTGDTILYTGGAYYEGGTGIPDTLIADFDLFTDVVGATGGVVIDGIGDYGAGLGSQFGASYVRGFERLVVNGTRFGDNISGGLLADYILGDDGNDILYGGNDAQGDLVYGGDGRDIFYWFDNGADQFSGGDNNAYELNAYNDMLIIGVDDTPGGTVGGLSWAFLFGLGNLGGSGRIHRSGAPGVVNASSSLADIQAAIALAAEVQETTAVGFGTSDLSEMLAFRGIEAVNIETLDDADDLILYTGGAFYDAGESAFDQDVFGADFSGQAQAIDLRLTADETTPIVLSNGVTLAGIDRLVLTAGSGNDVIHGNRWSDYIDGGEGVDRLFGGDGDDTLLGGAGGDIVYWMADGWDYADGGDDDDRLIVTGATPGGDTRELGIWMNPGDPGEINYHGGDLSMLGLATLLQTLPFATGVDFIASLLSGEAPSTVIALEYDNFELVDVIGSDAESDLIFYDGGTLYWGGDGAAVDLFVGEFSSTTTPLLIDAKFESGAVDFSQDDILGAGTEGFANTYDIGNGTHIGGFERFGLQMGLGDDTVIGGALDDYIDGGAGDDLLESGGNTTANEETILGGIGDDTLTWQGGDARLDGGFGGDDKVVWTAQPGAVSLTIGDDLSDFETYASADLATFADMQQLVADFAFYPVTHFTFDGSGTNDLTVTGFERMAARGSESFIGDVLIAMDDRSQLFGGEGDDVLISGADDDMLNGGFGDDRYVFFGGFGFDQIFGEKGGSGALYFVDAAFADLSFSNFDGDLVIDSAGGTVLVADYWTHGGYDFTIHTTDITGGTTVPGDTPGATPPSGNIVNGTDDDDPALAGSFGDDTMSGGAGNDEFLGSPGADVYDGGSGIDVVSYAGLNESIFASLKDYRGFSGSAEKDSYANIEGIIAGMLAADLEGDRNDNFLAGSPEGDFLDGDAGDDMLVGLEGDDSIDGDDGDDVIFGDEGEDLLFGAADNDYISGGDDNDSLEGEDGNDTLEGGRGNDMLRGGLGTDVLFYGGEDSVGSTGAPVDGVDTLDGGGGTDLVDLTLLHAAATVTLSKNVIFAHEGTLAGSGPSHTVATLIGIEELRGTSYDDHLTGDSGNNYFDGFSGDDTFVGASGGTDTLFGGDGVDFVDYGGLANKVGIMLDLDDPLPTVTGPGFTDHLIEIEAVTGSFDADDMRGDDNNNMFWGENGVDTLMGRGGDDWIEGGQGFDLTSGGDGFDIYSAADGATAVNIDMAMNTYQDGHGNDEDPSGFEGLQGTAHDDTLTGNIGSNLIKGGDGNDTITGDGGADKLFGDAGDDRIVAGEPSRVLIKPESAQNDLNSEAPLLNDYMSLTEVARRTAPENTRFVPTATVHATTSGVVDVYEIHIPGSLGGSTTLTVDIDASSVLFDSWVFLRDHLGNDIADNDALMALDPGSTRTLDAQLVYNTSIEATYYIHIMHYDNEAGGVAVPPDAGLNYTMHVALDGPGVVPVDLPSEGSFIYGGDGNDTLLGQIGADQIFGGADDDDIDGGAGDDLLYGNDGADIIQGFAGSDLVVGGEGDDSLLSGGSGRDTVEGGLGNDNITDQTEGGFDGSDLIKAGDGNDSYYGLGGDDTVEGGDGSDYILIDAGDGNNLIDGGSQADTILSGDGNDTVIGGNGLDLVLLGAGDDVFIDEHQDGPYGGDTVQGNGGADTIMGLGGNDSFEGGYGFDDIQGGNDDDTLHGNQGNDTVDGGAGNDLIFGGAHDDLLLGGAQDDTIEGGDGNDTVDGGGGRDVITLGAGADLFDDVGQAGFNGADSVSGDDGDDTLLGDGGEDTLSGGADNDRILGGIGNDLLSGDAGDDSIEGGAGNDTIDGGSQADTIFGDDNDDHVTGGLGADTVFLGKGADTFVDEAQTGPNGADLVFGGIGDDTILGDLGADTFHGGGGKDLIEGGGDGDSINGGDGADTLFGGDGNDTVEGGRGQDFADLGAGDDVYDDTNQGSPFGDDTVLGGDGSDTIFGDQGHDSFSGGAGLDSITGGDGNDTLRGGSQGDTLMGDDGDDVIEGGLGLDLAQLGVGADTWIDDAQSNSFGADVVDGGIGDDTIGLFGGDDTVTGGAGADTFVLMSSINEDVVTDYDLGIDALQIDAGLWNGALTQSRLDALTSSAPGAALELTFDNGDTLTLDGLTTNAGLLSDISLII